MNDTAMRPLGPPRMALDHSRVGESRRVSRTLQIEFRLIHAARNVGGEHEKEIDALGGAGESPTCRCHERGDQEGSHSAHYVGTVLLCCEQLDCCPSCRTASNPSGDLMAVLGLLPGFREHPQRDKQISN